MSAHMGQRIAYTLARRVADMDLSYWASTDIGQRRANNEDNFLIDGALGLFVVADGMGGHADGATASAIAVHAVRDVIAREFDLLESVTEDPTASLQIGKLLEHAVHAANDAILSTAAHDEHQKGMGTTLLVLLVHEAHAYLAHVGDSRIFLRRSGVVYQLTRDHSILNELLRQGRVTEDSFANSPFAQYKNALARAVGPEPMVDVDTLDFELSSGDTILMCSDGLHEYADEALLVSLLAPSDPKRVAESLVALANDRGGKDNITALVVKTDAGETPGDEDDLLAAARRAPLFEGLSGGQLIRLMNLSMPYMVAEGEALFFAYDEADGMYLLLDGCLDVWWNEQLVARLEAGTAVGALALAVSYAHPATITAASECRVLFISRADFQVRAAKDPALSLALLGAILERSADAFADKRALLGGDATNTDGAPSLDPLEL